MPVNIFRISVSEVLFYSSSLLRKTFTVFAQIQLYPFQLPIVDLNKNIFLLRLNMKVHILELWEQGVNPVFAFSQVCITCNCFYVV